MKEFVASPAGRSQAREAISAGAPSCRPAPAAARAAFRAPVIGKTGNRPWREETVVTGKFGLVVAALDRDRLEFVPIVWMPDIVKFLNVNGGGIMHHAWRRLAGTRAVKKLYPTLRRSNVNPETPKHPQQQALARDRQDYERRIGELKKRYTPFKQWLQWTVITYFGIKGLLVLH